jgi:Tol biopolymer transport system component
MADISRLTAALADRYRIERELGAGGMATVYLAHDLKHDRDVAIKVLIPELAAVLGADRFVVEIKTTASLQHPHILPLFDSGTADGFLYYVMPYIQGETIREKLNRETQFGVDEAVRIAREIADALDYAHRHGVIHRDIKPENILLHDGRAMVMDFGIALALSAAAGGRMTETGLSFGTPHYMSPEQATAEKELTPRSDVYSLASVLYEMLTGDPPFTASSAQAVIMKIITEPARPMTALRKSVPANVAAAVGKALEKLPADRFDSAKAFSDALANPAYSTAQGGTAAAAFGAASAPAWKRLFFAAAIIASMAIIAALWAWRRPAAPAEISRFTLALPENQALALAASGTRVALSLDGRTLVYVGVGSTAVGTQLWLRPLDQLRATPVAGTEGAINPAFSPDGKRLAFVSGSPRGLRTIAIAGGPATLLTDSLVDQGGVSWAKDGYIYYDGHLTGDGLARVRETGGKPEVASVPDTAVGESFHITPNALPNGRGVIFTTAHRAGGGGFTFDVGVLDTKSRRHKILVHGVSGRYVASGQLVYVSADGSLMAAPFDESRMKLTGDAASIAGGLAVIGLGRTDIATSDNGMLIYAGGASQGGQQELVWVSRDGTSTAIDSKWTGLFTGRPVLSPDGKSVAVARAAGAGQSDVWVKQLDQGPALKISEKGGVAPGWWPDGKSILFNAPEGLARGSADGSTLPTIIRQEKMPITSPEVSRDGEWVVYASGQDLFALHAHGDTARVALLATPAVENLPALSPDGHWLAYASDESGTHEVYVRPFPDTKSAKKLVSSGGGNFPRWSRDGRELFYTDLNRYMIAVPVTLQPVFSAGLPKSLFPALLFAGGGFDVSPDGKRFIMSGLVGGATIKPDELVVVQNFFEELRAKVKPKK